MTTQIIYSKESHKHDNAGHPENARRLDVILEEIQKSPFVDDLSFVEPDILPEKNLYEVHAGEMIEIVKESSAAGGSWIDPDTYVCKDGYDVARLAAGGLVMACKNVLSGKMNSAFVLTRPPGHHATRDRSMGFCLFNNAALAAHEITKTGKHVLIFDPDVHHGNGTQDIFFDRNDVMYQSIHLSPYYPGTGSIDEIGTGAGKGFTINAPLSYGNGNSAVSQILDEVFLPVAREFKPDLIIFSSGFDSHHLDPLGGLKLTSNFYGELIKKFQEIQPKIVCTLEGGYNLEWIGKCLVSQLGQLTGNKILFDDVASENTNVEEVINRIKSEIKEYWKI